MDTLTPAAVYAAKAIAAILAGVLLGNGAVWCFNKMPRTWFLENGQDGPAKDEDAAFADGPDDPYAQRLSGSPWKYLFSMLFVCAAVWLVWRDWRSAVPTLAALWILVLLALSDWKYRILPDQLEVLLAVTLIGFLGRSLGWRGALLGAGFGFAVMGATELIGRVFFHRSAVGGGDVKLFTVLGALTGWAGILSIFVMATLSSAARYAYLLAKNRIRRTDTMPYAPYVAGAAFVYWLFLQERIGILVSMSY